MPEFPFSRLRRFPDVEAPNLQAWDATDELLVARAFTLAHERGIPGSAITVIGDGYGALTLPLVAAGLTGVRVHQDLVTGRRALVRNAAALLDASAPTPNPNPAAPRGPSSENGDAHGVSVPARRRHAASGSEPLRFPTEPGGAIAGFAAHELDAGLLHGARLVLLQLPKGLAELEEIADAVARWAAPDAVLLAGGRAKHMTLGQNDVLDRFFAQVQPQRAERKSRILVATDPRPVMGDPPFPVSATHLLPAAQQLSAAVLPAPQPLPPAHAFPTTAHRAHARRPAAQPAEGSGPAANLTLCAYGGAFAGDRIDIGTRALLNAMADRYTDLARVAQREGGITVDLGCGTGALAAALALAYPSVRVIATDRSAAAVRSARATMAANQIADRVTVTLDDAGSEILDGSVDLVLLNPPFHLGASVHEGAGRRLIDAAARLLRPGGEVWTVFNSHLDHRRALVAAVGETRQLARTPKFTVTRSVRR